MKDLQKIYNQMPGIPMVVACFSMFTLALVFGGYVRAIWIIEDIRKEIAEIKEDNLKRHRGMEAPIVHNRKIQATDWTPPPVTQPAPKTALVEEVIAQKENLAALREPKMPEIEQTTRPPEKNKPNTTPLPEPAAPEVKKPVLSVVPDKIETISTNRPGPAIPVTAGISPALMNGQILATSPEQMRVILSLGKSRGVKEGQRFDVYRADKWVGDIRVTKTYEEMAACEIVSTPRGLRMGDLVKVADETKNSK